MVVARILLELQNMDLLLDEANGRMSSIEESLGDRSELQLIENSLEELRVQIQDLDRRQRSLDLSSKSASDKLETIESKLYGGMVSNPRELQDLGRELDNVKKGLRDVDEQALENLMSLEETEQRVAEGEETLIREEAAWADNQYELEIEKQKLRTRINGMEQQRQGIAKELNMRALEVYDKVRGMRAGRAVAMVERGLCRACGVTLPTHSVQRARSGDEPVQCGSCSSILYAS